MFVYKLPSQVSAVNAPERRVPLYLDFFPSLNEKKSSRESWEPAAMERVKTYKNILYLYKRVSKQYTFGHMSI